MGRFNPSLYSFFVSMLEIDGDVKPKWTDKGIPRVYESILLYGNIRIKHIDRIRKERDVSKNIDNVVEDTIYIGKFHVCRKIVLRNRKRRLSNKNYRNIL